MPSKKSRTSKKAKSAKAKGKGKVEQPDVEMEDASPVMNTSPAPQALPNLPRTSDQTVQAQSKPSHNLITAEEEKSKGKETLDEAKVDMVSKMFGRKLDVVDVIRIPDPSRDLRRLPCTPRFPFQPLPPSSSTHNDAIPLADSNSEGEYEYEGEGEEWESDSAEEELEEDRTIHAPLAHRMRPYQLLKKSTKEFLTVMYHNVEGSQQLLAQCGQIHKQIIPYHMRCFYRLPDKRVVGVLVDHDMHPRTGPERDKEVEAYEKWKEIYRQLRSGMRLHIRDRTVTTLRSD